MKRLFSICLGSALATTVFGQGSVRFSNVSADLSSPPDRLVRFGDAACGQNGPWGTNYGPVVNFGSHSYRAQLYYGASTASEASLIPLTVAPALFRASTTTAEPGTWFAGNRTLIGFDTGATVNLQVRVWDTFYGSTYELASGNPASALDNLWGRSAIFQYTIPTDPLAAHTMTGFNGPLIIGLADCPEPGTSTLTVFGIAALLIFRRRKLRKRVTVAHNQSRT